MTVDLKALDTSTFRKEEFLRMYKEMHDDDFIAAHMRKMERIKRKEDKMMDTGLYERPRTRTFN